MVYKLYGLPPAEVAIVEGPVLSAVEGHSKSDWRSNRRPRRAPSAQNDGFMK